MIIVTVEVPIMEISYDFQIDEDVALYVVKDEIAEMISRKNLCRIEGDVSQITIWDKRRRMFLDMRRTGFENGLETGSELILV